MGFAETLRRKASSQVYVFATSQEAFMQSWMALGDIYDGERDRLAVEIQSIMHSRPRMLNEQWLLRKRAATVALRTAIAAREDLEEAA